MRRMQRRWEMVWAAKEHLKNGRLTSAGGAKSTSGRTSPLAERPPNRDPAPPGWTEWSWLGRPAPGDRGLVEVEVKCGYLAKKKAVAGFGGWRMLLPENWDYAAITGLSQEAGEAEPGPVPRTGRPDRGREPRRR